MQAVRYANTAGILHFASGRRLEPALVRLIQGHLVLLKRAAGGSLRFGLELDLSFAGAGPFGF
jgi:hypothetical protein